MLARTDGCKVPDKTGLGRMLIKHTGPLAHLTKPNLKKKKEFCNSGKTILQSSINPSTRTKSGLGTNT